MKFPKKVYNNNVKSFDNLLSNAKKAKLIIYASSSNVYSGVKSSVPLKENLKVNIQKYVWEIKTK